MQNIVKIWCIPFNVFSTSTKRYGSLARSNENGDTSVTLCPLLTSASSNGLKPKKWLLASVGKNANMFDGFAGKGRRIGDPSEYVGSEHSITSCSWKKNKNPKLSTLVVFLGINYDPIKCLRYSAIILQKY